MKAIHIDWQGPFTLEQVAGLTDGDDYGLYQIYGMHPTYCRVELLYIGLASKQTFGVRVLQDDHWWIHSTRDVSQNAIYVGRLLGTHTPDNIAWEREIELAEDLLLYAHYPSFNKHKDGAVRQPEFPTLHVFNWGAHRDLLQEVSGARLGVMPAMMVYGKAPNRTLSSPELSASVAGI